MTSQLTALDLFERLRGLSLPDKKTNPQQFGFAQRYEFVLGWKMPEYQLSLVPDLALDGPQELLILALDRHLSHISFG